ncbi:MAG: hypothetical protein VR70_05305 [Rhodospirillaceae bacterium BRH_c57]|nr:MAG: hypothetical protein VR70_05305 [Rhodospirillaceae bacterium BRH_c57]
MHLYELSSEQLHKRVFEFLRGNGLIRTRAEFCQRFLGKSRGYLATLECLGSQPSRRTFGILRSRLTEQAERPLRKETQAAIRDFIREIDELNVPS